MDKSDAPATTASADQEKKPWGKLTSITIRQSNIDLIENEYTFGRTSTNTIAIPDKRLSSVHCKIFKDEDGKAYIIDLSTNGTFHENEKIGKNVKKELNSGDKIYLLHHSKVSPEDVLGYIFSYKQGPSLELKKLREEDLKALAEQKQLTEKQMKLADDLGEEMKCCICIDYIYQCVTLVPCLHNFCAACFSDWMQKSKLCPNCREEVTEVKKNSTINNIIEKYLDAHSEKKRPKQEYEQMDKQNKLTTDRLVLKENTKKKEEKKEEEDEEEEEEDEYDEDEEDEDEEDEEVQCLECVTARRNDGFKCTLNVTPHLYCGACYRPFPDRRNEFPQQCVICKQAYCNLYWPCTRPRSVNRLDELQNYQVPYLLPVSIFRGNHYEVKVLNDFLMQNKQNCRDMFQEFLRNFVDANKFTYKINKAIMLNPPYANAEIKIERKSPICTKCFENVWFQIVFRYRESINKNLPADVRDRTTCWYGINCRTMIHKPDHAKKLNHICEQVTSLISQFLKCFRPNFD